MAYTQLTLDNFFNAKKRKTIDDQNSKTPKRPFHIKIPQQPSNPPKDVDCAREFTTTMENVEEIKRLLDVNGFAIIKDVLNSDECGEIIDGVWDSMEKITADVDVPLNRRDPRTWATIKTQENLRNIYKFHGIVHADFFWKLRQHPKVLRIFSHLYGCRPEELLVSFDGLSMQTPPEYSNRGWFRSCWYHVDQSYTRPKRECFQGWITARDVYPGDFTTGFFVGSHKSFGEFGERFGKTNKTDFNKIVTNEEMKFYESRHDQVLITCPAGSLVVWDSRLVHSGFEPRKERQNPSFRTVCFLSYGPRINVSNKYLQKRVKLYENRRATSHWTHKHLKTIPERKSPLEPKIKKLESKPNQTKMLKFLVGYNL